MIDKSKELSDSLKQINDHSSENIILKNELSSVRQFSEELKNQNNSLIKENDTLKINLKLSILMHHLRTLSCNHLMR